ncbi:MULTISPECIES: glycosyltransferase family 39 protein [unclassified Undibacterium]|uniref:ArnT family glycosyltransferase n=1 Tax=unclassified Undibacterium TaxID=2630295 RepID=UPI002AC96775|nr:MULTISPECIES: glycosyltransferase family 39 protein [unclassified Undibacterium]MEB0137953.1 glycosyltransferase family 39 protein [Undibacterium sp. CCC2.1]MEB0173103.1 glycosyltransferase family 39 protein [Undibacterium sp. CCC1.1]MEB0174961.1 glycosyltransferase family 39 protein [Undibacterium sp. CCC3.4]MEB0216131.1 glycosyltransferase family 39 protein [Undibacterium sp. 5I2]WPX45404.1 glycosyltransferase family 39 protein [Undibacterium sp. CCC3.4]
MAILNWFSPFTGRVSVFRTLLAHGRTAMLALSTAERGCLPLLLLIAAYLYPGLIGHDPWKQDETYIFGIVHHMLESGDWTVPTMAGDAFMEKPPLYYWIAAIFAQLLSPWLALHDGARLATGLLMTITCIASAWTARQWWGPGYGRYAVLSLLGCLGLLLHAHMMLTDVPLLTGFAIATAGFVHVERNMWRAAALMGTGVGLAFMAKGVFGLGVFGVTVLALPLLFANWRSQSYLRTLQWALLFAAPWLLIWPVCLYLRSPDLFMEWFWLNNVGRYFGFAVAQLGAPHTPGFWATTLPWFAFPAMPLALLTIWQKRRSSLMTPALQVCGLVFGVSLFVLWRAASARDNYALPLLLPLAIMAAPAARHISAGWNRSWDWSARLLFGAAALLIWLIWGAMIVRGAPPEWLFLLKYLPRDFAPSFSLAQTTLALVVTLAALYALPRLATLEARGLVSWVGGTALCWMLMSNLLLPWVDHAKSYRSVFSSMQSALPGNFDCMASKDLGESERAMLGYFAGITTYRQENFPDVDCDLLLVNGLQNQQPQHLHDENWRLLWDGARPGDSRERLWLFAAKKMHVGWIDGHVHKQRGIN